MIERTALYPQHALRLLRIKNKIYKVVATMDCEAALSKEPIKKKDIDKAHFKKIDIGTIWGSDFDCGWFKFKGQIPKEAKDKHVVALISLQGEGVVYIDGKVKQGITQVLTGIDYFQSAKGKQVIDLFEKAEGGENIDILVDAGFNGKRNKSGVKVKLERKDIAICNDDMLQYYYDYYQLFMLMLTYNKNSHLTEDRLKEIDKALDESYKVSKKDLKKAHEILTKIITTPIDYDCTEYTAIGHAHLDLGWLWPIRETKRKGVRTFATAINNMKKYEDYKFGASQAQLFSWIKEEEPQLYEEVKKAVDEGKMEIQGGMWVENDCNIPCGESIIRQFIYGEKFFVDEFGKHCKMVWLPDVFGYPASLPQIIKKCNKDYFMTIKLTWNMHNKFPYKTFIWKGIDGTEVLSHMAPQGDYNSTGTPLAITKSDRGNPQQDKIKKALLIYGVGDGGGGPGEAQNELLNREVNNKGLDKVVRRHAEEFFDDLKKEYMDVIPTYEGELYLEKHQGTYTSQANNKKFNRKIERALHTLEWLNVVAKLNHIDIDQDKVDSIWKEVLLYQFHDIIPGSSIKRIYDETTIRYQEMFEQIDKMQRQILSKISTTQKLTAINPIGFDRKEYVKLENSWYSVEVPKYSAAALIQLPKLEGLKCGDDFISNEKIKVTFDSNGVINSVIDKELNREICKDYLNKLVIFTDPKMYYNAWDIRDDYRKLKTYEPKLVSSKTYIDGPECIRENEYLFNKSTIIQFIKITINDKLITFDTHIDWHESYKMLRAEFIPTIFADKVNCDIQFGNVDRSTKDETSIEKAQFEICAHQFVNVDEDNYGLALMNDCKYGHRVKEGLISLNLLRSPKYPDPTCDMGTHHFTYALYPHEGKWQEADVVKRAYCLNNPLLISDYMLDIGDIVDVDNDNIIIETIKPSEDKKGLTIRLYERYGEACTAKLRIGIKAKGIYWTDMLENNPIQLKNSNLDFTPYEIKTIVIQY